MHDCTESVATACAPAAQSDAMQHHKLTTDVRDCYIMRILSVDDHRIVVSGCRALFADDPEIVILEGSDAESGERVFLHEHPDICILDITLPTVSGFELARRILARVAS